MYMRMHIYIYIYIYTCIYLVYIYIYAICYIYIYVACGKITCTQAKSHDFAAKLQVTAKLQFYLVKLLQINKILH